MRTFLALMNALLYCLAILGMGFGVAAVKAAADTADAMQRAANLTAALIAGAVPFLIGTVALGSAIVVSTIMTTSDQRLVELKALHQLATQAAKREMARDGQGG